MTSNDVFHAPLRIDAAHPSLPGHFPGCPLVPGVVMLEAVANAVRAWRDLRLARIVEVKFIAPLLPGELANIALSGAESKLRFEIRRDDQLLARGVIEAVAS